MTAPSSSTITVSSVRRLLSAALAGVALAAPVCFAQAPAVPSAPMATMDPVEAFSDPRWTGRPQAPALLRKEAAAALAEGRRRCARERAPQARSECMQVVAADHRLMLDSIDSRRR